MVFAECALIEVSLFLDLWEDYLALSVILKTVENVVVLALLT